jgi:hypothetical protein
MFKVSRSSYYEYLAGSVSKRAQENEKLLILIRAVHQKSKTALWQSPDLGSLESQTGDCIPAPGSASDEAGSAKGLDEKKVQNNNGFQA